MMLVIHYHNAHGAQRKRGKNAIITSTAYKLELKTSFKNKREEAKAAKKQIGNAERNAKISQ